MLENTLFPTFCCNCTLLLLFILSWVFVYPPLLLFSFSFLSSSALPPYPSFYRKFSPICCTSKPFMFCSVSSEHVKEPRLMLLWKIVLNRFLIDWMCQRFLRSPSFLFQSIPCLPFILKFILSFFGSILISHTLVCIDGAPCLCAPA